MCWIFILHKYHSSVCLYTAVCMLMGRSYAGPSTPTTCRCTCSCVYDLLPYMYEISHSQRAFSTTSLRRWICSLVSTNPNILISSTKLIVLYKFVVTHRYKFVVTHRLRQTGTPGPPTSNQWVRMVGLPDRRLLYLFISNTINYYRQYNNKRSFFFVCARACPFSVRYYYY